MVDWSVMFTVKPLRTDIRNNDIEFVWDEKLAKGVAVNLKLSKNIFFT